MMDIGRQQRPRLRVQSRLNANVDCRGLCSSDNDNNAVTTDNSHFSCHDNTSNYNNYSTDDYKR